MPGPIAWGNAASRRRAFSVGALLLATAARAHDIGRQSLWFDEAWSAYAATRSSLAAALTADATNPPVYYGLLYGFARGVGDSELALRGLSLLLGVLAVALAGRLAAALAGEAAGRFALLAAACAPLLWWASREARMYSLLAVLALLCALAWHRLRADGADRRAWALLVAAEAALLYAHNTGPVAVAWLNAVTLAAWLAGGRPRRPPWRAWVASQALVLGLWLPWLWLRFRGLEAANRVLDAAPDLGWTSAAMAWTAYWAGTWSVALHEPAFGVVRDAFPFLGIAGVALVATLLVAARKRAAWPVLHAGLLSAGVLAGLVRLGLPLHGRYLVIAAPFVAVALGISLAAAPRAVRAIGSGLLVLALAAAVAAAGQARHARDDVRGVVREYAERLGADDTVMAWSYADRYDLAYYWPRAGAEARRFTVPEGASLAEVAALLPSSGRVAVNVWPTQRADERGLLPCLLGHGSREPPERVDHGDMETWLFAQPPRSTPRLQALEARWPLAAGLATIAPPDGWSADRALCVPLQIVPTRALDVDLKARIDVRNGLGMSVAGTDVVLADDGGRRAPLVTPGSVLSGFALLRLPTGAPGGAYTVTARLYDEARQPWGYVPETDGAASGPDVVLADWSVAPGAAGAADAAAGLPHAVEGPRIDDRTLRAASIDPASPPEVRAGESLEVALLWTGTGPLPSLELAGRSGDWAVPMERHDGVPGPVALDWLRARVPVDAPGGEAVVRAVSGVPVGVLRVRSFPRRDTPPPVDIPVAAAFEDLADLVGVSLRPAAVAAGQSVSVELVWRARAPIEPSLTVFVHLRDASGDPAGQSDRVPVEGERPTTTWRPGEIVVDTHVIEVASDAARGAGGIEIGLYDAATGVRWPLDSGDTSVWIPGAPRIEVGGPR